ncbi:MAG TPA: hypothetical protein PLU39_02550 [Armatimonadota bacterium]|nr:hypothetical protein [Armatimonadota bacterium]
MPATEEKRQEFELPAKELDGIPWRALLIGTLLMPPLTLFGHLSYVIVQSARWTADTLLRGPVVLLFLLVSWSLVWRRFSPRLGRTLALSRSELVLIYLMATVGTALAGECWAVYVVPALLNTAAYQAETARPEWAAWLGDSPSWFAVQDPEVIRQAHRGNASLYRVSVLRALAVPVLAWSVLMLALALFTQCLAQLVRRQWIERERLSFPLIHLPMTLVAFDAPRPWWRTRLFWAGVTVAGIIQLINGLNYLVPNVPYIPVKWIQFPPASDRPWSGLGRFQIAFYPFVIAIGFMVPLEVSFSMWFFFWLGRVQDMVVTILGHRSVGGHAPSLPPYHLHQAAGAFLVLGAAFLWRSRHEIAGIWRKAAEPTGRRAGWALIGSVGVILAWAYLARIPLPLATLFLVIYGLFAIVLGRLIAESGSAMSMSPLGVHETAALLTNLGTQTQQSLVAFGWWHHLGERLSDNLLPHQVTGMRMAEDVSAGRRVQLFLAVGAVVGVLTGIWALLHIYFKYGIMSAEVRDWPARWAPQYAYGLIQNWLRGQTEIPREKLIAFVAGGGVSALLLWLRQSYLGWPLHPIGYAVAGHFAMQQLWCPFFVAWLVKLLTMRFGGIRTYRALLPFFLGAILGDYLVPMGWAVVGLLSGQQMYLSYPH